MCNKAVYGDDSRDRKADTSCSKVQYVFYQRVQHRDVRPQEGEPTNMNGRLAVIVIWMIAAPALSQVRLQNGQFAGTLPGSDGINPISYFFEDAEDVASLQSWANLQLSRNRITSSSEIYDNFIIIGNPEAIVDGKINPRYSTFAEEEVIFELNRFMDGAIVLSSECVALPTIVAKDGIKKTILLIYVLSSSVQEQCLGAAFSIVSQKG